MSERTFHRLILSLPVAGLAISLLPLAQGAEPEVTFSKDIAPIFERACQNCHRPGAIAPMSLLTYKDARPWARSIKVKVAKRQMPPGQTDIVVTMPKPYVLKATGGDEYYDVEVDPGFKEDVYVSALETKPDLGFAVVHHCTTNLVEDPVDDPVGLFLNEYAVGKNADIFPSNSGRLIKAGSKIHFNVHLHPDGKATPVQISLGLKLYPKDFVPKYIAFTQHMGDSGELDLPAGQITRNDGYFRLPKPAVMTAYQPHFHMRGKAQCIEAIYPDVRADSARPGPARTDTLSCVSDYQFGWSITYNYAEDVSPILPAGTMIHVTTWHDNTDNNIHNPNPKNWVGGGQRTNDEMSFAWVSLFYVDDSDYQARVAARKKMAPVASAGFNPPSQ